MEATCASDNAAGTTQMRQNEERQEMEGTHAS